MSFTLNHIPKTQYRRATWKNGLGHTDEVTIQPPGSDLRRGDFLFRLSSAQVAQNSPFSIFPDHDRILVILKGAGMRLRHQFDEGGDFEEAEILPLEPYEFPGDIKSECELISGPVTDFSVFFRKGALEAQVEVGRIDGSENFEWKPRGKWNYLFVIEGPLRFKNPDGGESSLLSTWETIQVVNADPGQSDESQRTTAPLGFDENSSGESGNDSDSTIRLNSPQNATFLMVSLSPC